MLTLPWFPPDLKPNARVYRLKKALAAKQYRQACYLLAKGHEPMQGHLKITFYPPDRRPRDLDNCLAAIKSGLDGIADAWGINDRLFRPLTIDFGESVGATITIEFYKANA
jgi:crossover junction endodeoxyribonuclease RusA